eukprot:9072855-Heterocapsa_arctica.AAC.1
MAWLRYSVIFSSVNNGELTEFIRTSAFAFFTAGVAIALHSFRPRSCANCSACRTSASKSA